MIFFPEIICENWRGYGVGGAARMREPPHDCYSVVAPWGNSSTD
jgi:hypothetical protein